MQAKIENNPIGIFDSGIGGLTVLKELISVLPKEDFIYFADCKNAPYGPRTQEEVIDFSRKIINFLLDKNCKIIIIACNTATAAAIQQMRKEFKIPIIGLEPAVKPACLATKTNNVGVLATEGTFRGSHFKNTSEKYKKYVTLHLEIAKELVEFAEQGIFSGYKVENVINKYIQPLKQKNVDNIVLGCTHYPFFRDVIEKVAGKEINIIDSSVAVARRTKDVLMTMEILRVENKKQNIQVHTSNNLELVESIYNKHLLQKAEFYTSK